MPKICLHSLLPVSFFLVSSNWILSNYQCLLNDLTYMLLYFEGTFESMIVMVELKYLAFLPEILVYLMINILDYFDKHIPK